MADADENRHSRDELEWDAARVGKLLKAEMPEGVGFALLVFGFGEGGNMAYLSNANRRDMIAAMIEFIRHQLDGELPNP